MRSTLRAVPVVSDAPAIDYNEALAAVPLEHIIHTTLVSAARDA
jgi:hypothetical protein